MAFVKAGPHTGCTPPQGFDRRGYCVWKFEEELASTLKLLVDADLDGDVDGNDFLTWQTGIGSGPGAAATSVPVPEPTAPVLLLLGAVLGIACRGHWRLCLVRRAVQGQILSRQPADDAD
jgi:hypothetical protein